MKPIWVLENDVFDEGNPDLIAQHAKDLGCEVRRATYVPFGMAPEKSSPDYKRSIHRVADELPPYACVVFYGSLNGCKWVLKNTNWTPGIWVDFPKLTCQSYYAYYGEYLLNSRYIMMPLAEVKRCKGWLFTSAFGPHTKLFVRPDDNAKSFGGEVVDYSLFDKWWDYANFYDPGKELLTIIAPVKPISKEWRVVIADGEPITASQYRSEGNLDEQHGAPTPVLDLCRQIIEETRWTPSSVFTMDVALSNGEFKLIEIGSFNGAGLYQCDTRAIVNKVSEIAVKQHQDDLGVAS